MPKRPAGLAALAAVALSVSVCLAAESGSEALPREYAAAVRPMMVRYCQECHGPDLAEAELDLSAFATFADVRRGAKAWLKIREMLDSGQMPPPEADQPSDAERNQLRAWVRAFLTQEAQAQAGDPGPVELRRLDNAEYTYVIRDLTGVESLDPAAEFPVDGAAGEGFTNVGSGQGMSPALVQKYLDAAKRVAAHAVLVPSGIRFSPHTSGRDRTDELLARIQAFYRRFTADGGGTAVNLQGIEFETNQGGLLPVEKYLAATLAERDALRAGRTTLDRVARERPLNARYLAMLWETLAVRAPAALGSEARRGSLLLDDFRDRWARSTANDAPALAAEIATAQRALWKFNSIGHIGREGGPTRWMEAVSPITARQELRLELPQAAEGNVVLYLAAEQLDGGPSEAFVVYEQPRIEFAGETEPRRPPILLRDVRALASGSEQTTDEEPAQFAPTATFAYGLDADRFGRGPPGAALNPDDLGIAAPHVLEVRLPAAVVAGGQFVTSAVLVDEHQRSGAVQVRAQLTKPTASGPRFDVPVLVDANSAVRPALEAAMREFRELFPPALCYARIVPVDEVVTLTLFHREDDHLRRLMLDEAEAAELDQLWDELYYVGQEPLALVVAYEQISEFATQDRPDLVKAFAPLKGPIEARAEAFKRRLVETEPTHVEAALGFASRAWRRPLADAERQGLRNLYARLRQRELPHDEAIRLLLARALASPSFLHKIERPPPGPGAAAASPHELASRLSFFLWSSVPDEPLRAAADAARLSDERELLGQTRRMLADPRTRRLAVQFACQWLHVRDFAQQNDKNERLFPEFAALRADMFQETVLFFEDLFRNNGSILDVLEADHTFVNEALAKHYGLAWPPEDPPAGDGATAAEVPRIHVEGPLWRRVAHVRRQGRGGILGMATFLASQSGASRTSPILRGNWVYETLLGEGLPRPPAGVPVLPERPPAGLTERQLIEQHSSVAACAKCHAKIDPYGFALEQFDAIGRLRGEPVDTRTTLVGGQTIEGLEGLRGYLAHQRRADFVSQFCRKLLGYALGREVQLSDEPLLAEMREKLEAGGFRVHVAVETIALSPQFRNVRGLPDPTGDPATAAGPPDLPTPGE